MNVNRFYTDLGIKIEIQLFKSDSALITTRNTISSLFLFFGTLFGSTFGLLETFAIFMGLFEGVYEGIKNRRFRKIGIEKVSKKGNSLGFSFDSNIEDLDLKGHEITQDRN